MHVQQLLLAAQSSLLLVVLWLERGCSMPASVCEYLHVLVLLPRRVVQLGMQAAPRQAPGVAGREVNLMVNHFALSIRPGSSMAVYSVSVTRSSTQQQEEQQQQEAAGGAKQQLPRGLVRRLLAQLAADAGWPSGWLLLGGDRLAAGRAFLPTNVATEAVVTLQQQQQHGQEPGGAAGGGSSSSGSSETFKVCARSAWQWHNMLSINCVLLNTHIHGGNSLLALPF